APSRAATELLARGLVRGRVLDYGCGYGLDADWFGWQGFDPYYRPCEPEGPFDTIVCTLVLNVLSRNNRPKVIARLQSLLAADGCAYVSVPRNVPVGGKLGVQHCLQNYVVLSLPMVLEDDELAIYVLRADDQVVDATRDFVSRRDARRDR